MKKMLMLLMLSISLQGCGTAAGALSDVANTANNLKSIIVSGKVIGDIVK